MLGFNLKKPVKVVTSWQEAKEIEDRNAIELEQNGFEAKFITFTLEGEALKVKEFLDSLKKQN